LRKGLRFDLRKEEIIAGKGVIATNHPLASTAGIEIYASGGNAFDAAIASLFALTVVEPMMVSVFGAGFFVIRDAQSGKLETVDNYAKVPHAATDTMYEMVKERKPGQNIFETVGKKNLLGPLAVATPGTLKAWEYIKEEHGNLDLGTIIAPAIKLARYGYKSSPFMNYITEYCQEDLRKYPATAKTYLPLGKPIQPGTHIELHEYAETLEEFASQGSDTLYHGKIGKKIIDYMQENGVF
jgi:gamma-glutamyltranspeptidase/glutathione hydrolase